MAYVIKKTGHPKKDGTYGWRLAFEDYSTGKKVTRYPKQSEWPNLGILPTMSKEEALERVRQLNANEKIKFQERQKNRIALRLATERTVQAALLPEDLVKRFEEKVLLKKLNRGDKAQLEKSRMESHWAAVRRMLATIQLEPSEWSDEPEAIYNYLEQIQASPSYAQKLLRVANHWGYFLAKETGKPFLPVAPPKGVTKERIADRFFEKDKSRTSEPITPDELEAAKSKLLPEHYRWLYVAIWFGLRPGEVDSLSKPTSWRTLQSGDYETLTVYQPKLTSLPRQKRWKLIPILFEEQRTALKYIQEGQLKRPLPKTVRKNVKDGANCYGPRKGFTDLMLSRGYTIESIAAWMGHTSIERTWRSYKNRLSTVIVKKS